MAKARGALETTLNSQQKVAAALLSMELCLQCLAKKLPDGATALDAEALTRQCANEIGRPMDAAHSQSALDAVGRATAGSVVCPVRGCGSKAHSLGVDAATFKGTLGRCPPAC